MKPKMDKSMRWAASDSSISTLSFFVLGHKGSLVISFPIDRTPRADGEISIQSYIYHP
jgi:hypothetical protein